MAAELSRNRIAWSYTSDDGNVYRVAAMKAMTDQNVLGGSAAAGTVQQKPSAIKLRRCTVSDASGNSRVVPVYDDSAPIKTAGTAINVNIGLASFTLTSNGGVIPEGGPKHNVTKEST